MRRREGGWSGGGAELINLTAYILTWNEEYIDFLDINLIGVTIGSRF